MATKSIKSKLFCLAIIIAGFLIISSVASPARRSEVWLTFLGLVERKMYFAHTENAMNWTEARSYCESSYCSLASIDNQNEARMLGRALTSEYGPSKSFWTSGRKPSTSTNMVWDNTGNQLNTNYFSTWHPAPDKPGDYCLRVDTYATDKLEASALNCSLNYWAICQCVYHRGFQ